MGYTRVLLGAEVRQRVINEVLELSRVNRCKITLVDSHDDVANADDQDIFS
jgi:hypothetical protein